MSTVVMDPQEMSLGNESTIIEAYEQNLKSFAQSPHAAVPTTTFHNDHLAAVEEEAPSAGIEHCSLWGRVDDIDVLEGTKRLTKACRDDNKKVITDLPPRVDDKLVDSQAEPDVKRVLIEQPCAQLKKVRHTGQYLGPEVRAACRAPVITKRQLRKQPTSVQKVKPTGDYVQMKVNHPPKSTTRASFLALLRTILNKEDVVAVRPPWHRAVFFDVTPEGHDKLLRLSGHVYWDGDTHAVIYEQVTPLYSSETNGVRDFIPLHECNHPSTCEGPLYFTLCDKVPLCDKVIDTATPMDTVTPAL